MFAVQLNGIKYSTVCRKHLLGVKLLGNREDERVCVNALGNCNTNVFAPSKSFPNHFSAKMFLTPQERFLLQAFFKQEINK